MRLFKTLFILLIATLSFGQTIDGGGGVIFISSGADPNNIAAIASQTNTSGEAMFAYDKDTPAFWIYDDTNAGGSKWELLLSGNITFTDEAATALTQANDGDAPFLLDRDMQVISTVTTEGSVANSISTSFADATANGVALGDGVTSLQQADRIVAIATQGVSQNTGNNSVIMAGQLLVNSGAVSIVTGNDASNVETGAFVGGNENSNNAGGDYSFLHGRLNTNSGSRSTLFGNGNTNSGNWSFLAGLSNNNNGASGGALFGTSGINRASYSLLTGSDGDNDGSNSFLYGNTAINDGDNSSVGGQDCTNNADGDRSSLIGLTNTNSGTDSFVGGRNNTPDANRSMVVGDANTSLTGINSVYYGTGNQGSGNHSFLGGSSNIGNGINSGVFGTGNTNSGGESFVGGTGNTNTDENSIVSGQDVTNGAQESFVIGDDHILLSTQDRGAIIGGNDIEPQDAVTDRVWVPYLRLWGGDNLPGNTTGDTGATGPDDMTTSTAVSSYLVADPLNEYEVKVQKIVKNVNTQTANYTVDPLVDDVILCGAGCNTIQLANTSANILLGQVITVKDIDATTFVVVSAGGGATIDGATNYTFTAVNEVVEFIWDGTNWYIL